MAESAWVHMPQSELLLAGRRRYVTNTRIKFVLVLDEPVPKDEEMRMVRRQPAVRALLACEHGQARWSGPASSAASQLCHRRSASMTAALWCTSCASACDVHCSAHAVSIHNMWHGHPCTSAPCLT